VVIDWGVAKQVEAADDLGAPDLIGAVDEDRPGTTLTAEGKVLGTPQYMPPEQARGESIDARADVYALGACLYHTLSGAAPYSRTTSGEVLAQLIAAPPPPLREIAPDVPVDLAAVVTKAMARERADRYATAKEMADDVRRFADGRLVVAHDYTARELTDPLDRSCGNFRSAS
jgi:eukaryotic-like serine/threonine-protein kinase